jgi:hypothetical protein
MNEIQRQQLVVLLQRFEELAGIFIESSSQSAGDVLRVEAEVSRLLLLLRSDLVTSGLQLCVQSFGRLFCCPGCASALRRWGERARRVTTSEGEGNLASARYRCVECRKDYYPFEEANGLSDGHFTTGAKARIAGEAACAAFAEASTRLGLWGVLVSPKEVDRIVREVAGWRQEEEVAAVAGVYPAMAYGTDNDTDTDTDTAVGQAPPLLHDWSGWVQEEAAVVSVDGGMIRSPEPGAEGLEWFEGRAAVIAPAREGSCGAPLYLSGVHVADEIFSRMCAAWQQGPHKGRLTLFVSDGAAWIWERQRYLFSEALPVLDFYHAGEHLESLARACFGEKSKEVASWCEAARRLLRKSNSAHALLHLLMPWLRGKHPPADAEALRKEFGYFWRNRHRMPYQWLEERKLPIGSGIMESAIKQILTKRLRQPGMKWSRAGADAMLCLRAAHLSGALQQTVQRQHGALQTSARRYNYSPQALAA